LPVGRGESTRGRGGAPGLSAPRAAARFGEFDPAALRLA